MAETEVKGLPAVEDGHGPPMVFLHGYPLNHRMWDHQLAWFAPRTHVLVFDLPGFGEAKEIPTPDTLEGFAAEVHVALRAHALPPAVIVGHSFGGYVALQLYRDYPDDFAGLVLTDTRAAPDSPEVREKRLATATRLETAGETLDVEATVKGLFSATNLAAGGPEVGKVREMVRSVPSSVLIPTLRAIAGRPDLNPILGTVQVPALVVWGADDALIPPAQSQSMVAAIRGAVGVEVPQSGHLPMLERPDRFSEVVGRFIERSLRPIGEPSDRIDIPDAP